MGTVSNANPNPNPNPYPYPWIAKDCSSGICSIYCPQWCYIVNSPPPPSLLLTEDSPSRSAFEFSPLIVAVIGVVASALVLLTYYTLVWKVCGRRRTGTGNESAEGSTGEGENGNSGLEESVIKSISVRKYVRGGAVEPRECSVCLSEFQDNQTLRLLPPCNHAFHLPCIDPWLYSNATCPLCRSTVTLQ